MDSIKENLCLSCIDNYYPKEIDDLNHDNFIKCYQNPKGFYYNKENKKYKECFNSCETCINEGNNENHNCSTCKQNFLYELKILESINCYKSCKYYNYTFNNKYFCTKEFICPENFNKIIPQKKQCIDHCKNDDIFKYEFRNICYEYCPLNISKKSDNDEYYCEPICDKKFPFEIIKSQACVNNCSIIERKNNICKINYISKENNDKEAEEKAIENIKDELTKDFDVSEIDNGEDVVIEQEGSKITISSSDNQREDKSLNNIQQLI